MRFLLIPWVRERAHTLRVRERVCALENAWESYSGFRVWSRVTGRRRRRREDEAEEKSSYPGFGERGIMGTIPLRGPQASSAGGCEERVVSSFSYGEEAKKKGSSSSLRNR